MWEQIIVRGMAILWGLQWVVYQLATSHETSAKKCLSFPKVLQFVKRICKINAIKSHLQDLLGKIAVENMDRRSIYELWCNMKNRKVLNLNWIFKEVQTWKNMIWSSIWYKRIRIYLPVIWKVVYDVSVTLKGSF